MEIKINNTMAISQNNSLERWKYIVFSIIIFISMGTIYSWSIFRDPIEKIYNIGATKSGMPYMIFLATYAATMYIAGQKIGKYKPHKTMLLGAVIFCTGFFLSAYAPNITILTITYGIISGAGVGILYGVPIKVVAQWFPDKKGFALGLTLLGFGLSPFVTAPLSRWLLTKYHVFDTFKILGIIFMATTILPSYFFKYPPTDHPPTKPPNHPPTKPTNQLPNQKSFRALWICFFIGTMVGLTTIGISTSVGEEIIKINPAIMPYYISIFALFNGLGRPLFGWLTDKLGVAKSATISFSTIIIAATIAVISREGNNISFFIAFSLLWLNLGGWLSIAPTATMNLFGEKNYTKNYGTIFTAYGVGAILGVLASGLVKDTTGSYMLVFYPIIVLAFLGIKTINTSCKYS